MYNVLLYYPNFRQKTSFITDYWFFEGSFIIAILSVIKYPSVLQSFLHFKWKCHEGWSVRLQEIWLMVDTGRISGKLNTRRSKIYKPVQGITIQFWEKVKRPTLTKQRKDQDFFLRLKQVKYVYIFDLSFRHIYLEIFAQLLPIPLLRGKNIFQIRCLSLS